MSSDIMPSQTSYSNIRKQSTGGKRNRVFPCQYFLGYDLFYKEDTSESQPVDTGVVTPGLVDTNWVRHITRTLIIADVTSGYLCHLCRVLYSLILLFCLIPDTDTCDTSIPVAS